MSVKITSGACSVPRKNELIVYQERINTYESILERSKTKHSFILKQMRHYKRNIKGFDRMVHGFRQVFDEIDCTKCGLCCRNMGPIFRNTDIKHLRRDRDSVEKSWTTISSRIRTASVSCSKSCPVLPERGQQLLDLRRAHPVLRQLPHTKEENIQRRPSASPSIPCTARRHF